MLTDLEQQQQQHEQHEQEEQNSIPHTPDVDNSNNESIIEKRRATKNFCIDCGIEIGSRSSYFRHRHKWHPDKCAERSKHLKCGLCPIGDGLFRTQEDLCSHLNSEHNLTNIRIETETFDTESKYLNWRAQVEKSGSFRFSCMNKCKRKTVGLVTEYLKCFRSGTFDTVISSSAIGGEKSAATEIIILDPTATPKSSAPSKRPSRSIKLNFTCSAFAKVKRSPDRPEIIVEFCLEHYGHGKIEKKSWTEKLRYPKQAAPNTMVTTATPGSANITGDNSINATSITPTLFSVANFEGSAVPTNNVTNGRMLQNGPVSNLMNEQISYATTTHLTTNETDTLLSNLLNHMDRDPNHHPHQRVQLQQHEHPATATIINPQAMINYQHEADNVFYYIRNSGALMNPALAPQIVQKLMEIKHFVAQVMQHYH